LAEEVAIGRILVTGGSGFVGRYLLPRLRGDFPAAELHATRRGCGCDQAGVVWHRLDVRDGVAVTALVASLKPDVVIHLAAQSDVARSFEQPAATWNINLDGALNLQRALAMTGRGVLVQVGSADMYGASFRAGVVDEQALLQPLNPYAASKAAADLAAYALSQTSSVHVIRCRPFNHTGAGQSAAFVVSAFARQIAQAENGLVPAVIKVGDLSGQRDFLHVSDVVAAYSALVRCCHRIESGRAVNICSGEPVAISTVLAELVGLSSIDFEVVVDSGRLRKSDIPQAVGRADLLRSLTGWSRRVERLPMLASVLGYWRDYYAAGRGEGE
jgi:GDP-4-dehydro-6-deoxy-D-mannose reductase